MLHGTSNLDVYCYMIWLAFFICIIAFLSISDLGSKKINKNAIICTGILMSLTAGLRNVGGIGADYNIYMDHYNGDWVYGGYFDGYFELGYCAIVWLCSHCGISYNIFILLLTTISVYFLLKLIYENSPLPMFSVLLYLSTYYLFYNMVLLRQMVAVVAFIYCIYFIIKNENKKFLLSFFVGCLFHYSIIILLFAYLVLRYWKINIATVCILLCVGLVLKIVGINTILALLLESGGSLLVDRTADYLGNNDFSLNPLEYIKMFFFGSLILFNYKKIADSLECQILLKSYICFCILIIAFGNIEIFFRIAMYFDLATLFLIPIIFKKIAMTNHTKIICYCCLASFTVFAFLYRAIHFNEGEFFMYNFYFL